MQRIYQSVAAPMFLTVVLLAAPGTPQRQDFYHARGSQIVDSHGKAVRISGISWWGLETPNFAPLGLDKRPLDDILSQVHDLGFNTLRIPYSNQMLHGDEKPKGINYDKNPELNGLTSLQVMDHMVAGAREHGMRVILDRHRPDSGEQAELWYTAQHSEEEWIADWKMLAARYKNDDTVIGFDLHNEPHGSATWGSGDKATDWRLAAERAGNAVLSVNPNLLILVEGIETVNKDGYWWGGNLSAAGRFPVRLSRPAQLVYAAHDYPPSVGNQRWFQDVSFPRNLTQVWSEHWGYLAEEHRVPVLLGEFGTHYQSADDKVWMSTLVSYLAARNISAMYWGVNPESDDTGGIFQPDWQTVDHVKMAALEPLLQGRQGVILTNFEPAPAGGKPVSGTQDSKAQPIEIAALEMPAAPQAAAQDPAKAALEAQKAITSPVMQAAHMASAPVMEAASAALERAKAMAVSAFTKVESGAMPVVEAAGAPAPAKSAQGKKTRAEIRAERREERAARRAEKKASREAPHVTVIASAPAVRVKAIETPSEKLSALAQAQRQAASAPDRKAARVVTASVRKQRHGGAPTFDFEPKNPLGNATLD